MIGIIFDKDTIEDAKNFLSKIGPTKRQNLIFIVVDNNVFFKLEGSTHKKDIIDSDNFISSVKYNLCGVFDKNKNTIYLEKCDDEWVELLLETINKYFEESVHIVIPFSKGVQPEGFRSIHPCAWDETQLCGIRQNKFLTQTEKQNTFLEQQYLKTQKGKYCTISLQLDRDSIDYLKYVAKAGVTVGTRGKRSQKEVFGHFRIIKSELQKGEIIHTLKLDKDSIVYGTEDEISTTGSLYTFHSHPFNAYLLYKTKFGVPSASDYWAVYNLCKKANAIVHFVSSLEGLYVISCVPDSHLYKTGRPEDIKNLIWKKLKIKNDNQVENLQKYIDSVNKIGLFKLMLLPWEDIENKDMTVSFTKIGKTCLIHDSN
uniref:Uncharacterized protein n=1 Tax=viral metagenome TaxID=1070528 RepID=A0A6C0KQF0_9ZZZZ